MAMALKYESKDIQKTLSKSQKLSLSLFRDHQEKNNYFRKVDHQKKISC